MTEANIIGILILFKIKSNKIEEAETKIWAWLRSGVECGPSLSHSFMAGGYSVGRMAQLLLLSVA